MKNLTPEEFMAAPAEVQIIYLNSHGEIPMGISFYESVIKKYPEYFPDEVEHRRKWERIPQDVHDDFWAEYFTHEREASKGMPESKGILHWVDHPEEYEAFFKKMREVSEKMTPIRKMLYEKHYKVYGIQFTE